MNERTQTAIGAFEAELRDRLCRQNDEDLLYADLTGLYVDIIGGVSAADRAKAGMIYDYAKLLEQDLQLYSGAEAYIAGRNAKNKPETEALTGYMLRISGIAQEQRLHSRIQEQFEEIAGLLGDKRGLIAEFTEVYRTVHGIIASNIHEFIRLGQASDADMAAAV
jgi:hypothetical protein